MEFAFSTDGDTKKLFEIIVYVLKTYFGYAEQEAVDLVNTSHAAWSPYREDDFYHHDGFWESAVRIHYFTGLQGNPSEYHQWRRDHYRRAPAEAWTYFRDHYFVR